MKTDFVYNYVKLSPQNQIRLHSNDNFELSLVITGTGKRTIGDTVEPFTPGDLVLIPPGIPHCWFFENNKSTNKGLIENISLFF
jgi:Mannose-6-phosphate isomerase